MHRIFVYGTLKQGGSNHARLLGQRFVTKARTRPEFRMYDLSGYPGIVDSEEGVAIEGEVWEVDDEVLRQLDELEGVCEGLYERRTVHLLPPHESLNPEIYVFLGSIKGRRDLGTSWA